MTSDLITKVRYPCCPEATGPCVWAEIHHIDDQGRHWCPTGILRCTTHGGIGETTGTCRLQGQAIEGGAGDGK